ARLAPMENKSTTMPEAKAAETPEADSAESTETGRMFSWVTGTYEPVTVISRGSHNGEKFVMLKRVGRDLPVTVFEDEYDYWQSQASKFQTAPNTDEAAA